MHINRLVRYSMSNVWHDHFVGPHYSRQFSDVMAVQSGWAMPGHSRIGYRVLGILVGSKRLVSSAAVSSS